MTNFYDPQTNNVSALVAVAQEAAKAKTILGISPGDVHMIDGEVHDFEYLLAFPERLRESYLVHDAASFARLVNEYRNSGTRVFVDARGPELVAVLNDHDPTVLENEPTADACAKWADHRVGFEFRFTPDWQAWASMSGAMVPQYEFAQFLEDHARDVVDPDAATLLELAMTFEATKSATFRSATRLNSGARQLVWNEEVEARAGQTGQLEVPTKILVGLQPFDGADRYQLEAHLRYRINDGVLRLGLSLDRPDLIVDAAVAALVTEVESLTSIVAMRGHAPQPRR